LAFEKLPGTFEDHEELFERAIQFKAKLIETRSEKKNSVLVITHSGLINSFLSTGIDPETKMPNNRTRTDLCGIYTFPLSMNTEEDSIKTE